MRLGLVISLAFWAFVASACTGCAGWGVEARAGLYREDSRSYESKTYNKPLREILFGKAERDESSGS